MLVDPLTESPTLGKQTPVPCGPGGWRGGGWRSGTRCGGVTGLFGRPAGRGTWCVQAPTSCPGSSPPLRTVHVQASGAQHPLLVSSHRMLTPLSQPDPEIACHCCAPTSTALHYARCHPGPLASAGSALLCRDKFGVCRACAGSHASSLTLLCACRLQQAPCLSLASRSLSPAAYSCTGAAVLIGTASNAAKVHQAWRSLCSHSPRQPDGLCQLLLLLLGCEPTFDGGTACVGHEKEACHRMP